MNMRVLLGFVLALSALICSVSSDCGCTACSKGNLQVVPTKSNIEVIFKGQPCGCGRSLPYQVEIPVETKASDCTTRREYGYQVQVPPPIQVAPRYTYDYQVQVPVEKKITSCSGGATYPVQVQVPPPTYVAPKFAYDYQVQIPVEERKQERRYNNLVARMDRIVMPAPDCVDQSAYASSDSYDTGYDSNVIYQSPCASSNSYGTGSYGTSGYSSGGYDSGTYGSGSGGYESGSYGGYGESNIGGSYGNSGSSYITYQTGGQQISGPIIEKISYTSDESSEEFDHIDEDGYNRYGSRYSRYIKDSDYGSSPNSIYSYVSRETSSGSSESDSDSPFANAIDNLENASIENSDYGILMTPSLNKNKETEIDRVGSSSEEDNDYSYSFEDDSGVDFVVFGQDNKHNQNNIISRNQFDYNDPLQNYNVIVNSAGPSNYADNYDNDDESNEDSDIVSPVDTFVASYSNDIYDTNNRAGYGTYGPSYDEDYYTQTQMKTESSDEYGPQSDEYYNKNDNRDYRPTDNYDDGYSSTNQYQSNDYYEQTSDNYEEVSNDLENNQDERSYAQQYYENNDYDEGSTYSGSNEDNMVSSGYYNDDGIYYPSSEYAGYPPDSGSNEAEEGYGDETNYDYNDLTQSPMTEQSYTTEDDLIQTNDANIIVPENTNDVDFNDISPSVNEIPDNSYGYGSYGDRRKRQIAERQFVTNLNSDDSHNPVSKRDLNRITTEQTINDLVKLLTTETTSNIVTTPRINTQMPNLVAYQKQLELLQQLEKFNATNNANQMNENNIEKTSNSLPITTTPVYNARQVERRKSLETPPTPTQSYSTSPNQQSRAFTVSPQRNQYNSNNKLIRKREYFEPSHIMSIPQKSQINSNSRPSNIQNINNNVKAKRDYQFENYFTPPQCPTVSNLLRHPRYSPKELDNSGVSQYVPEIIPNYSNSYVNNNIRNERSGDYDNGVLTRRARSQNYIPQSYIFESEEEIFPVSKPMYNNVNNFDNFPRNQIPYLREKANLAVFGEMPNQRNPYSASMSHFPHNRREQRHFLPRTYSENSLNPQDEEYQMHTLFDSFAPSSVAKEIDSNEEKDNQSSETPDEDSTLLYKATDMKQKMHEIKKQSSAEDSQLYKKYLKIPAQSGNNKYDRYFRIPQFETMDLNQLKSPQNVDISRDQELYIPKPASLDKNMGLAKESQESAELPVEFVRAAEVPKPSSGFQNIEIFNTYEKCYPIRSNYMQTHPQAKRQSPSNEIRKSRFMEDFILPINKIPVGTLFNANINEATTTKNKPYLDQSYNRPANWGGMKYKRNELDAETARSSNLRDFEENSNFDMSNSGSSEVNSERYERTLGYILNKLHKSKLLGYIRDKYNAKLAAKLGSFANKFSYDPDRKSYFLKENVIINNYGSGFNPNCGSSNAPCKSKQIYDTRSDYLSNYNSNLYSNKNYQKQKHFEYQKQKNIEYQKQKNIEYQKYKVLQNSRPKIVFDHLGHKYVEINGYRRLIKPNFNEQKIEIEKIVQKNIATPCSQSVLNSNNIYDQNIYQSGNVGNYGCQDNNYQETDIEIETKDILTNVQPTYKTETIEIIKPETKIYYPEQKIIIQKTELDQGINNNIVTYREEPEIIKSVEIITKEKDIQTPIQNSYNEEVKVFKEVDKYDTRPYYEYKTVNNIGKTVQFESEQDIIRENSQSFQNKQELDIQVIKEEQYPQRVIQETVVEVIPEQRKFSSSEVKTEFDKTVISNGNSKEIVVKTEVDKYSDVRQPEIIKTEIIKEFEQPIEQNVRSNEFIRTNEYISQKNIPSQTAEIIISNEQPSGAAVEIKETVKKYQIPYKSSCNVCDNTGNAIKHVQKEIDIIEKTQSESSSERRIGSNINLVSSQVSQQGFNQDQIINSQTSQQHQGSNQIINNQISHQQGSNQLINDQLSQQQGSNQFINNQISQQQGSNQLINNQISQQQGSNQLISNQISTLGNNRHHHHNQIQSQNGLNLNNDVLMDYQKLAQIQKYLELLKVMKYQNQNNYNTQQEPNLQSTHYLNSHLDLQKQNSAEINNNYLSSHLANQLNLNQHGSGFNQYGANSGLHKELNVGLNQQNFGSNFNKHLSSHLDINKHSNLGSNVDINKHYLHNLNLNNNLLGSHLQNKFNYDSRASLGFKRSPDFNSESESTTMRNYPENRNNFDGKRSLNNYNTQNVDDANPEYGFANSFEPMRRHPSLMENRDHILRH